MKKRKLLQNANLPHLLVVTRKLLFFIECWQCLTCCVLGALLRGKKLMDDFRTLLVISRIVKTFDWIVMFMFEFGKGVTVFGFFHPCHFIYLQVSRLIVQPSV